MLASASSPTVVVMEQLALLRVVGSAVLRSGTQPSHGRYKLATRRQVRLQYDGC